MALGDDMATTFFYPSTLLPSSFSLLLPYFPHLICLTLAYPLMLLYPSRPLRLTTMELHLMTSSSLLATTATPNCFWATYAARLNAFKRGQKAASSLRLQRRYLAQSRAHLAAGNHAQAEHMLRAWAIERAHWRHLIPATLPESILHFSATAH